VILVRLVVAQEGPVYTGAGVAGRLECSFCDYTAREVRRDPGRADPAPPQVVFTADLRKVTRIFNADALHDPATRAQWEELLAKAPRQDVRKSGSFFEFHLPVPGSADARGAPSGGSA
jgi:hypothetical protein